MGSARAAAAAWSRTLWWHRMHSAHAFTACPGSLQRTSLAWQPAERDACHLREQAWQLFHKAYSPMYFTDAKTEVAEESKNTAGIALH